MLNPSGHEFSTTQDAIINIKPERAEILKSDNVEMAKAGTLQSLIDEENFFKYDTLRIKGEINGTDLKTIRAMAGRDEYGEKTDGKLRVLDLSKAKIIAGGDAYLMESGVPLKISNDNVLPKKAFLNCVSLRQIILPEGIKSFGIGALGGCSRLNTVTLIPAEDADFKIVDDILYSLDETTIIGSLPKVNSELNISGKVTRIDDFAFSGKARVLKLTLGEQLTSIGERAFGGCALLKEIRVINKTPLTALGTSVFEDVDKTSCKLYVRAGNTDKFKSASQWGDFINFVEFGTTIKARNAIRLYGEENPKMGYSLNGDYVEGTPDIICDATPESPAGKYPIRIEPGTITEPAVDYEDGFLIIKKAPLAIGVEDAEREEGQANPNFKLTFEGFKNNDTEVEAFTELPVATCEADEKSPVGTYTIVVSGGESENYKLSYGTGTLTITAATGISVVDRMGNAQAFDIYTIDGQLLVSNAKNLDGLNKGVYIMAPKDGKNRNMQKVIIRKSL